ncbi:MAG TPA: sulfurtransferase [Kribbellaceae bacterium]|jgi:thiosulfate/3-mercaptopyruvate sulfurtransferase
MSSLVSAPDLAAELAGDRPPVLVDVSYNLAGPPGRGVYDAGHLPGAYFVDLDAALAAPPGAGGRHPLPSATVVEAALRRCGVSAGTPVVVYDQATSLAAARAWWVFRYFGLAGVRVLDGGLAAWREAGGEVTTDVPADGHGEFTAVPGGMPMLDAEAAADLAKRGVLVDVRVAERYAGETEPIDPVAGHIPGAVNAPATDLLRPDGRYRPAADLRTHFAALGVDGSSEVGTYCGSGVTAAQAALALDEAGIPSAVYIGSWSDWITDPTRPVALGPTP